MPETVPWLAPGVALFRAPATPDEPAGWRLRTADGGMLAVDLAADVEPDGAGFADQVALGGFGPPEPSPLGGRTVGLQIPARFAAPLRQALGCRGASMVAVADGDDADPVGALIDVLVSVSDGPAPEHWLDFEDRLPADFPWFRVAVEGRLAHLEPPRIGPRPVTHRAVRARRLATAHRPVELSAYWSQSRWSGPAAESSAGTHLLAELLVRDLERWAAGTGRTRLDPQQPDPQQSDPRQSDPRQSEPQQPELPPDRRLRILDLHALRWTDHPILPVPDDTDWRDGR